MATLTVQTIDIDGATPSYASADGSGDDFTPTDPTRVFLHVKNGSASEVTVTLTSQLTAVPVGSEQADITYAVAASDGLMVGPMPSGLRDDDGAVHVGYSDATDVEVAAFEID